MSVHAAHPVTAGLLADCQRRLGGAPQAAWWVPGRIELLGKHTDYAGGRSLTCATTLGLVMAVRPREDDRLIIDCAMGQAEVRVHAEAPAVAGWAGYAASVARRLARHVGADRGCQLAIAGNLPAASGMSSSSAVVVGIHAALAWANRLSTRDRWRRNIPDGATATAYLGGHENGAGFAGFAGDAGVGTWGGSGDHAAILLGQADHLSCWSYAPPRREALVRWNDDLVLAVAVSGVIAEKTGAARAAYNDCAGLARQAIAVWNQASGRQDPHLGAALDHAGRQPLLAAMRDPLLYRRVEQFIVESSELVPGVIGAIADGDHRRLGTLVQRSQALAESHLGNQVPETVWLAAHAGDAGAIAASAFGAGFGGAVWAAFHADEAGSGAARWLAAYRAAFPTAHAAVHLTRPGAGLTALHDDDDPWVLASAR